MPKAKFMADSNIIWYNSVDLFHSKFGNSYKEYSDKPGFDNYRYMHQFFALNFSFTDRSKTIIAPIKTKLLPQCALPTYKQVDYEFEELCNNRARWLIDHAKNTNRKLCIMYSGGIDSTLIVVSLLKVATDQELKENVIICMNDMSINENPKFYKDFISKKCKIESSYSFSKLQGNDKYIVVNGEGGDQLFGSAVMDKTIKDFGQDIATEEPTFDRINMIFSRYIDDKTAANSITNALSRIVRSAPIKIETVFHYFWWINFITKWQSVYLRSVSFTHPDFINNVKLEDNYFIFFGTKEMQLWAMNNPDKLIKDNWNSYKYHCKDIIYNFNGDENYRDNKLKYGSLAHVVSTKKMPRCMDENMKLYFTEFPENIWNKQNDFI